MRYSFRKLLIYRLSARSIIDFLPGHHDRVERRVERFRGGRLALADVICEKSMAIWNLHNHHHHLSSLPSSSLLQPFTLSRWCELNPNESLTLFVPSEFPPVYPLSFNVYLFDAPPTDLCSTPSPSFSVLSKLVPNASPLCFHTSIVLFVNQIFIISIEFSRFIFIYPNYRSLCIIQ